MSDRDTFIRAVIAAPDDDGPRLYFADWLEGRGELERAEFIRIQCRLAEHERAVKLCHERMTEVMPPGFLIFSKREALHRREREYLVNPHYDWLPVVTGMHGAWGVQFGGTNHHAGLITNGGPVHTIGTDFRRGFVEEITCSWSDWQHHARAIMAATPLRRVRLTTWPDIHPADLPQGIDFELPTIPLTGDIVYGADGIPIGIAAGHDGVVPFTHPGPHRVVNMPRR